MLEEIFQDSRCTTPVGFAYFDKGIWVGIIAIKAERVQIHSRLAFRQQLRKCARVLTCC